MRAPRVIEIEDRGQDFTELCIDANNVITEARPFQTQVWQGWQVANKRIGRGTRLRLRKAGHDPLLLRYPVLTVKAAGR